MLSYKMNNPHLGCYLSKVAEPEDAECFTAQFHWQPDLPLWALIHSVSVVVNEASSDSHDKRPTKVEFLSILGAKTPRS